MPPRIERKICVLGSRGVGKSTVTIQFVENHFIEHYNPTIEDTFQKIIKYKGVEYNCVIIDTAGQDEFSLFHSRHSLVHGYIFVYSINSLKSLETIKIINDKLLNALGKTKVPRVIVGNKTDLILERKVTKEVGQALANEWGCPFVECSGKHGEHIDEIFTSLIAEIEKEGMPKVERSEESGCILI